jgi:uncharacterized protein YgfB (UPF0149 family)
VARFLSRSASLLWLLAAAPACAADPIPACDLHEMPEVCQLQIQRNHVMNDLALSEGQHQRDTLRAESLAQWWKEYAAGSAAQREWWASWEAGATALADWQRRYDAGLETQLNLWKEICARHHC